LNRIKSFDATGIAPNGRLFAGDLNLIQDTAAALLDYAQNLAVGSLAIGASDTTLTHYGAQEMAVSGLLRVLGIFRAASGIIVGSYTTTARDALVSPAYGLVILNSTTNQYEWNSGTPTVPNWVGLGGALPVITSKSANYTLVFGDHSNVIEMNLAGANTLTVPPNSSVAFPVGTTVTVIQAGAGQTTITPGAGVTIHGNPGLKMAGQWSTATLLKRAADDWILIGNISS
jgi:hypothetical protein